MDKLYQNEGLDLEGVRIGNEKLIRFQRAQILNCLNSFKGRMGVNACALKSLAGVVMV